MCYKNFDELFILSLIPIKPTATYQTLEYENIDNNYVISICFALKTHNFFNSYYVPTKISHFQLTIKK